VAGLENDFSGTAKDRSFIGYWFDGSQDTEISMKNQGNEFGFEVLLEPEFL